MCAIAPITWSSMEMKIQVRDKALDKHNVSIRPSKENFCCIAQQALKLRIKYIAYLYIAVSKSNVSQLTIKFSVEWLNLVLEPTNSELITFPRMLKINCLWICIVKGLPMVRCSDLGFFIFLRTLEISGLQPAYLEKLIFFKPRSITELLRISRIQKLRKDERIFVFFYSLCHKCYEKKFFLGFG